MSKVIIERFGRECEVVSFKQDPESSLIVEMTEDTEGYINLGSQTVRLKGRSCIIDARGLKDGEHTPHLILSDMTLDLPKIKKQCGIITVAERESDFLTRLSLREHRLSNRVEMLEKRLEEITEKVWGAGLFSIGPNGKE